MGERNFFFSVLVFGLNMSCNDLFFRNVFVFFDVLCKFVVDVNEVFSFSDDNDEDYWGYVLLR